MTAISYDALITILYVLEFATVFIFILLFIKKGDN